jgi:hypothetical protein
VRRCSVPSEGLREELADAQWELGLEVHGLLVGVEDASDGLSSICTPHRSGQSRSGRRAICPPASACGAVLVPSAHDPAPLGQRLITVEGQAAEAAARAGVDPPAVGAGDRVHQLDEARLNQPRSGRLSVS